MSVDAAQCSMVVQKKKRLNVYLRLKHLCTGLDSQRVQQVVLLAEKAKTVVVHKESTWLSIAKCKK